MCKIIEFEKKKRSYARRIAPETVKKREFERALIRFKNLDYYERKKVYEETKGMAVAFGYSTYGLQGGRFMNEEYKMLLDIMSHGKTKKYIKDLIAKSIPYYSIR